MTDETVLEVPRRVVRHAGGEIAFGPLRVRQIPPFTRAVRPVVAALIAALTGPASPSDAPDGAAPAEAPPEDEVHVEALVGLIADHGETLIEAVVIATEADRAVVEDLLPDMFLELVVAVVQVNADFFVRAVRTATRDGGPLAGLGAGPTRSST